MPRGIKRDFNGKIAPMVGGKINRQGNTKISEVDRGNVAMKQPKSKQSTVSRRTSQRVVKAKRKLDFVYQNDKGNQQQASINNNAQIVAKRARLVNKSKKTEKGTRFTEKVKVPELKSKYLSNDKNFGIFDGVLVDVSADDEELDYEDDIADEEEAESMHQDHDQDGSPIVTDHNISRGYENKNSQIEDLVNNGLDLGAMSASIDDEQMIMNNPHLRKLLNRLLDE